MASDVRGGISFHVTFYVVTRYSSIDFTLSKKAIFAVMTMVIFTLCDADFYWSGY